MSADGERWVLLNVSPDLRQQLTAHRALWPVSLRQSPLAAVVLTDAELDHTLGLPLLRETLAPVPVYAPAEVLALLATEWPLLALLECYGGVEGRPLPDGARVGLADSSGTALGLFCTAIPLARRPPRYARHAAVQGCTAGLRVEDERGRALAYVPAAAAIDEGVRQLARGADLLCFDGTFWSNRELDGTRTDAPTARAMGHLPLGGVGGSLETLPALGAVRTVLVHVNNTNPILDASSLERRAVAAAGVQIAEDGMEFEL